MNNLLCLAAVDWTDWITTTATVSGTALTLYKIRQEAKAAERAAKAAEKRLEDTLAAQYFEYKQMLQRDRDNIANQAKINTLVRLRDAYSDWGLKILTAFTSHGSWCMSTRYDAPESYIYECMKETKQDEAASDAAHTNLLGLETNEARKIKWNNAINAISKLQHQAQQAAETHNEATSLGNILAAIRIQIKQAVAAFLRDISKDIQADIDAFQVSNVTDISIVQAKEQ